VQRVHLHRATPVKRTAVTGERIEAIAKSLWPFLLVETGILFLIAYWEDLTLFMPRLLGL
jgi:TRAP-type C4-dicarboxylate transport system permease large subunit